MILEKFLPSARDSWTWRLANLMDVFEMAAFVKQSYLLETNPIFELDEKLLISSLMKAIIDQECNLASCQIMVARNKTNNRLMGWHWLKRGYHLPYVREESAEAAFAQIDLNLPLRTRVCILAQMMIQWEMYCRFHHIPLLASTSIREDYQGYVKLHRLADFQLRGSFAFKRIDNA